MASLRLRPDFLNGPKVWKMPMDQAKAISRDARSGQAVLDATANYALKNPGMQRQARCVWILSGGGMGVHVSPMRTRN